MPTLPTQWRTSKLRKFTILKKQKKTGDIFKNLKIK